MKYLIRKYLESKVNQEEKEKLFSWLAEQEEDMTDFLKKEIEIYATDTSDIKETDAHVAFEKFKKELVKRKQKRPVLELLKPFYKYAASVVLVIGAYVCYQILFDNEVSTLLPEETTETAALIHSNIILTEADGSKKVIQQEQEVLSYLENTLKEEKLVYNEIKIPKGQVFRLVLSDSTVVWLNSDSKLKYPKKFVKGLANREVELEGEAFFKVAHNAKKPFIVNTKNLHIEVLGTAFNVSSYSEEKTIKTTLVKGAVKVIGFNKNGLLPIVLTPNHQAVYNKEKMLLNTIKVNTNEYTAWIQKKIIFNNTPFEELLKRIERTFNVKVINKNNSMKEELFTGEFDNESLAVIFKSLSTSFKFNYEIDEHIITIKP